MIKSYLKNLKTTKKSFQNQPSFCIHNEDDNNNYNIS